MDEDGDLVSITQEGRALLARFEEYRRSKGEPLPALDGPVLTDDIDDPVESPEAEEADGG